MAAWRAHPPIPLYIWSHPAFEVERWAWRPRTWEAHANWRHYSAGGHSRFRLLAAVKAVYNVTVAGLLWQRRELKSRLWWD